MIRSLRRYANFFTVTLLFRKERRILLRDFFDWFFHRRFLKSTYTPAQRQQALKDAVDWLLHAQDKMKDGGFGTYYIADRWTTSYPETSGYIIPTLIHYAGKEGLPEVLARCYRCADWLCNIQKVSGGWQSLYVQHDRPEVVFNTGQVIRGLVAAYNQKNEQRYLDSAVRACNWLVSIQEPDGSWEKHAFMNQKRVYDSYVDHPLLLVWQLTGNETYRNAAIKNLEWIINEKQLANGWFSDCDNTIKHNDRPILHTISYTIDGLINSGLILKDDRFVNAGKKAADVLLEKLFSEGWLHGRWNQGWEGSEYMICTGCAQISIVWLTLYRISGEGKYRQAAARINDQLIFVQQRGFKESANTKGALTGSYPLWGKYEPFGFPNWAVKYFADALMMESEVTPAE